MLNLGWIIVYAGICTFFKWFAMARWSGTSGLLALSLFCDGYRDGGYLIVNQVMNTMIYLFRLSSTRLPLFPTSKPEVSIWCHGLLLLANPKNHCPILNCSHSSEKKLAENAGAMWTRENVSCRTQFFNWKSFPLPGLNGLSLPLPKNLREKLTGKLFPGTL